MLVRTKDVLSLASEGTARGRADLQVLGRRLDEQTDGRWVAEAVGEALHSGHCVVVDAVRISAQLDALRQRGATLHIHLTAPPNVLAARYTQTHSSLNPHELAYEEVSADPTEAKVEELGHQADLVLDTATLNADDVEVRGLAAARRFMRTHAH
jgi:phage-related tail fiber protein